MPASVLAECRLFPVLQVRNGTDAWSLAGKIRALFEVEKSRAADLVLVEKTARSRIVYALAVLLDRNTSVAAQVLPRQRDQRARFRIIHDFRVMEDPEPRVFKVSAATDATDLAAAMMAKLLDREGNNIARTVQLEFLGRNPSDIALRAIEKLFWEARREITFVPRFEMRQLIPREGKVDPKATAIVISVTST